MASDEPGDTTRSLDGEGVPAEGDIDFASLTGDQMTARLNGIPGALDRAKLGWSQVLAGDYVPLSEL
jgi:hypothetical protein